MTSALGALLRRCVPAAVTARVPPRLRARARAVLGIEPWPDLAVRHPLFRSREYRALRAAAHVFDEPRPSKPVLERGHQTSYLVARWFAAAGVRSVFHVGYASGRYLFYLSRMGIRGGGTDLPDAETAWTRAPAGALDTESRARLLRVDFFELRPDAIRSAWGQGALPIDVLFSEATFETMLPWREVGVSVPKYAAMDRAALARLTLERLPAKLAELAPCFESIVLIEPEPEAGGAGRVFEACAERLGHLRYRVWRFVPPFDSLFRLSPGQPTRQALYLFTRGPRLADALAEFARDD